MPAGVSTLYGPLRREAENPLQPDDSYFLIRLHDVQAFFSAGPLAQVNSLLLSSSIESSFLPESPLQSLHQLSMCRKNVPCHPGVQVNLTDWLPARHTDTLRIALKYTVLRGAPLKSLVDKMDQIGLAAKLSLIRPEIGLAAKVSQVAGHLLSTLIREGEETVVFELTMDLNLARLQTGYYAVVGSLTDETWPRMLELDAHGRLTDYSGHELTRLSYAVIQVQVIKRRKQEALRKTTWGELLEIARNEMLSRNFQSDGERRKALQEWLMSLKQVRLLALKDQSTLLSEINDVIAAAHLEAEQRLLSDVSLEATGLDAYPEEWQHVLNVATPLELRERASRYQESLKASEAQIRSYQFQEV